jgi:16S rRNA processing protein RimM
MVRNIVAVGKVKAPNGLKGKMWITPLGDTFNEYTHYLIGNSDTPRKLVTIEKRKTGFVIKLEGIDDIAHVEDICGQTVYVRREWLPETAEDEFYWNDLIGMKVIDIIGRELGEIVSIIPTGSNDVFVVDREKQHMIPSTSTVIKKVSIEERVMIVDISSIEEILDLS